MNVVLNEQKKKKMTGRKKKTEKKCIRLSVIYAVRPFHLSSDQRIGFWRKTIFQCERYFVSPGVPFTVQFSLSSGHERSSYRYTIGVPSPAYTVNAISVGHSRVNSFQLRDQHTVFAQLPAFSCPKERERERLVIHTRVFVCMISTSCGIS